MRLLICGLLTSLALYAGVTDVKSVYVLPMAGGLDQYLVNRLTSSQVFRVVTDPGLADAIFTEQLGEVFERKLTDLFPRPDTQEKDENNPQPHASAFGRGKGTIFLVDLKTRSVIWSTYEQHNGSKPDVLNRTAGRIVQQIKKQQKVKE